MDKNGHGHILIHIKMLLLSKDMPISKILQNKRYCMYKNGFYGLYRVMYRFRVSKHNLKRSF